MRLYNRKGVVSSTLRQRSYHFSAYEQRNYEAVVPDTDNDGESRHCCNAAAKDIARQLCRDQTIRVSVRSATSKPDKATMTHFRATWNVEDNREFAY